MRTLELGAFHIIIATEFLEKMEVLFLDNHEPVKATGYDGTVCYAIRKRVDKISCGNLTINDFKLDFGVGLMITIYGEKPTPSGVGWIASMKYMKLRGIVYKSFDNIHIM